METDPEAEGLRDLEDDLEPLADGLRDFDSEADGLCDVDGEATSDSIGLAQRATSLVPMLT